MSRVQRLVDVGPTIREGSARRSVGRDSRRAGRREKAPAGAIWSTCLVVSFVVASLCSFVTAGRDARSTIANQEPPPAAVQKHQPPPDGTWTADAEVADAQTFTDTDLGAAQGIAVRDGKVYAYGDVWGASPRMGVIREYDRNLSPTGRQIKLGRGGKPIIIHPTGLTWDRRFGTFLGDTVLKKAVIYHLDWERAWADGTLDRAVLDTIDDDAAINGCRPTFVEVGGRTLLATADYGDVRPELRLYDPEAMLKAGRTSAPGVVVRRVLCGPFNQNLYWDPTSRRLTCVQNVIEGRGWRLDVLDLDRALADGRATGPGAGPDVHLRAAQRAGGLLAPRCPAVADRHLQPARQHHAGSHPPDRAAHLRARQPMTVTLDCGQRLRQDGSRRRRGRRRPACRVFPRGGRRCSSRTTRRRASWSIWVRPNGWNTGDSRCRTPAWSTWSIPNVSTFTAEADKAIRIGGPRPMIVHAEILAGRDLTLLERLHWYNTLLRRRHKLPVWTIAVLLRPAADGPELTGRYVESFPDKGRNLWFRYDVIRVWQQPPERLLAAGLPVLPLAPVSDVPPERLPEVLAAVGQRLKQEAAPALQETLWAATKLLMGLRYPDEQVEQLVKGVDDMILGIRGIEESSVYQSIFAKGEAKGKAEGKAEGEAKGIAEGLLRMGRSRLGAPSEVVEAAIMAISDRERLLQLADRLADVSTWDELLASEES